MWTSTPYSTRLTTTSLLSAMQLVLTRPELILQRWHRIQSLRITFFASCKVKKLTESTTDTLSCHSFSATLTPLTSSTYTTMSPQLWTTGFLSTVSLPNSTSIAWSRVNSLRERNTQASRKIMDHPTATTQQSTTNWSTTNILSRRVSLQQTLSTLTLKPDWMPWVPTPQLTTTERLVSEKSNTRV